MKHPDFASRFNEAVQRSGVKDTQEALAKLLGVSSVMIWSYRNGEKLPRMDTATRIATKLNVSVDWLLTGATTSQTDNPAPHHAISATAIQRDLLDTLSQAFINGTLTDQDADAIDSFVKGRISASRSATTSRKPPKMDLEKLTKE